jgi:hypothetical protein
LLALLIMNRDREWRDLNRDNQARWALVAIRVNAVPDNDDIEDIFQIMYEIDAIRDLFWNMPREFHRAGEALYDRNEFLSRMQRALGMCQARVVFLVNGGRGRGYGAGLVDLTAPDPGEPDEPFEYHLK